MKQIRAIAFALVAAGTASAPALLAPTAAEAKVRLAEVTLKRSSAQDGHARTDLRIVPKGGKLTIVSNVRRLRLILGVELRGNGKIQRVTLTLPRSLGGGRQTLFSNKSGGPSVRVDFRLRAGTALHNYVAARGFAICRRDGGMIATVRVPVGVAIDARNGKRRRFRVRRTVPIAIACPVLGPTVTTNDKLGNGNAAPTSRRNRSTFSKPPSTQNVDGIVGDDIAQRPQDEHEDMPPRKAAPPVDSAEYGSTPGRST